MTLEQILTRLHEAQREHHAAEKRLPAHDWADWYGAYMFARSQGATVPAASDSADHFVLARKGA